MSKTLDWHNAVIYEILPRSFYDTNNDGNGDLPGIIEKLPYLKSLGIDVLWLTPIYLSEWVDAGYDVTDHTKIDPIFGTIDDLKQLIDHAHQNQLSVMLDMVINHTSTKHSWFLESSSSRTNPKADWYTWVDGVPEHPPNNWLSAFGGSAWEYLPARSQYYLHTFYPQQADLNWRNPHMRRAIYDIIRYFLRLGVDGIRIDAASHFAKHQDFLDNPLRSIAARIPDPYEQQKHVYDKNLAERFDYLSEISQVLSDYPNTFMITESYLNLKQLQQIHSRTPTHNHTACNFSFLELPFRADQIYSWVTKYIQLTAKHQAIPNWILSNHDRTRVTSRVGPMRARLLAMLQLFLPGIAFIYYGDEIGMTEVNIPPALRHDHYLSYYRDGQRTPMQWSDSINAGFSLQTPWLPVGDAQFVNVQNSLQQQHSILQLYQQLLQYKKLRSWKQNQFSINQQDNLLILSFTLPDQIQTAILNFNDHTIPSAIPAQDFVLSTYLDENYRTHSNLRAFEGLLFIHR